MPRRLASPTPAMPLRVAAWLAWAVLALIAVAPAGEAGALTLGEADERLGVARRLIEGGIFERAVEIAASVLDHPAAAARSGDAVADAQWLERREAGRFYLERARLGLAETREQFLSAAAGFVQLSNNRYRLPNPAFAVQAAYWAGRAYESAGEYRDAVDSYSRVGGITLPPEMEGDAARRTSRCLRLLAEEVPYPGNLRDRQRRDRLLSQAVSELDRARLSFPIGTRRKEIELDLIALRLARRDGQSVREAATEAEAFIERDPSRDGLRARAALYRGQAAAILGDAEEAATWFRRVSSDESPEVEDRRTAQYGLSLALLELADASGAARRNALLEEASEALDRALDGAMSPGPWDAARVIKARVLLALDQPSAALGALEPVLAGDRIDHAAWQTAGVAELRRGRLGEALRYLYPPTRPSNPDIALRYAASRDGATAADARRDYGLALALNRQASRMLRRQRLFSSLLVSEFKTMDLIMKLGRMDGPMSLSGDLDLLTVNEGVSVKTTGDSRNEALDSLGGALAALLAGGADADSGYDLALAAEVADEWFGSGTEKLELSIGMISHLRRRRPEGITDSILSSRLGEARHALALSRAETILASDEPSEAEIDRALGDFASAAASFQEASGGGGVQDNLNQGMVSLESGVFLMRLSRRWDRGRWSGAALNWREEARQRIEASLRPFNQAIATSGPASLASRRARWSRGRALEHLEEWRSAAVDYLSLMNNPELPRVVRANAARRWAVCMGEMGESRQALTRLVSFADGDAEAALLAGRLAEETGNPREAFSRYLFAADPAAPALPPLTPDRAQEAAYRAAKLALADPAAANPLPPPETVRREAMALLENGARENLSGAWAVPMLVLLGEARMGVGGDGWREAQRLAASILEETDVAPELGRALRMLAAQALAAGGDYPGALEELDAARDLLDDSPEARGDAAAITLETARIYQAQGRTADALRAYADTFAVYPEAEAAAEAAREAAARLLLSRPEVSEREKEQARSILSGLRDQVLAERIMREYGIR